MMQIIYTLMQFQHLIQYYIFILIYNFQIVLSLSAINQLLLYQPQIKAMARGQKANPKQKKSFSCEVRRSDRVSSLPKNNYYLLGSGNFQEYLGIDESQENFRFKRGRKNHCHNDGSDYQDDGRNPRKKQRLNNRMEFLLDWKRRVHQQQIYAQLQSEYHEVKDISNTNLQKYGKNIQALFINIQWNCNSSVLEKLAKLKIDSNKLMRKGIAFIWTPKYYLSQIMSIMEKKHFFYVQNFEIINFNKSQIIDNISCNDNLKKTITTTQDSSITPENKLDKNTKDKKQMENQQNDLSLIKKLGDADPCSYIMQQKSKYFSQGKRTLLMFRKNCTEKIELRHQRTCDVVFDTPNNTKKCEGDIKIYVYNMIETLLPKCIQLQEKQGLKMMQLWGEPKYERRGWINIVQK